MKQKLHKELQTLLDWYRKQRQNLPAMYNHGTGVIKSPSFFTVTDLQRLLNNPLLRPEWVHVKVDEDRVKLENACFYKTVQGRELDFMDKEMLNNAINAGAAVVLEGIDILDAGVNEFVAQLDASLPCVMCNAEAFFSQQNNEAYDGHCDADDVLVIQLAGRKNWQLFQPQQRRYSDIQNLSDQQLGPVMQEISMRPGDALYVRAGVPHRCITPGPFSLHMSFDLVDNTPTAAEIASQASKQYSYACELPYESTSAVVDRYVSILKSDEFQQAMKAGTEIKREEIARFRQTLGRSSALRSLNKFS